MTRSFALLTIITPGLIIMWTFIFVDVFRYARYRMNHKGEQAESIIGVNEEPLLVLEFNNKAQKRLLGMIHTVFLALLLFVFFNADDAARSDTYSLFFFLNKDETYTLYFWTWKFAALAIILFQGLVAIHFFSKRVLFYKKAVVLENSVRGKRVLALNNNVRRYSRPVNELLYDSTKGINIPIFKKFIKPNFDQEKILADILSNIPQKRKSICF
jgi:hypothetical protein